jgi:exosortase D (VPLPA-CTERM-specific)
MIARAKISRKTIISQSLLIISFLLCYWHTIAGLIPIWDGDGDYSYAPIIPLIIAYLIWERRKDIISKPIGTSWTGAPFFILFLVISIYGILGSSPSAVRPAMPLIILSITLFCFGREVFKVLAFPLSLFIFMIPLSTTFQATVGVFLKSVSTKLGEQLLRICSVPVFVEGNVIDLGVTKLQVVDACSGFRFVLPLLAMGVMFSYFFEKVRWKQILLTVITIPIAIVANGMRIGITGILTQHYGAEAAEGFFHGFSGWVFFMFAFASLFIIHYLLKKLFKDPEKNIQNREKVENGSSVNSSNNITAVIICVSFLILTGLLSLNSKNLPHIDIKDGITSFPLSFNVWKGKAEELDPEIIKLSGAENSFNATYEDTSNHIVSLYIGYRGSPFVESENFFHSPSVCLPSSGWKTLASQKHAVNNVQKFGKIIVQAMLVDKLGQKQLVYFWFQTKRRISNNININRYHLALHAIQRDNTYDLFIRPIMPVMPDEKLEDAEKRMDQFVRDMMGTLIPFLKERAV